MNHADFKGTGYKNTLSKLNTGPASMNPDHFHHSFQLKSAYNETIMPETNYTYDFKGIIDYIFYGMETMRPLAILGSIDPLWFKNARVSGCPNARIPSGESNCNCFSLGINFYYRLMYLYYIITWCSLMYWES